jgi:hypothetical protein
LIYASPQWTRLRSDSHDLILGSGGQDGVTGPLGRKKVPFHRLQSVGAGRCLGATTDPTPHVAAAERSSGCAISHSTSTLRTQQKRAPARPDLNRRETHRIAQRLDPKSGSMAVFDAPRGTGPYGIATAPEGQVFFASLAGNYLGRIDLKSGATATLGAARAGARRTARLERQPRWAVDHRLEQLRSFPL